MPAKVKWIAQAFISGILLLSVAGCGGFQLRQSATSTPTSKATKAAPTTAAAGAPTPPAAPTPVPAAPTPEVRQVGGLSVGGTAIVPAGNLLNVRTEAKTSANKVGTLEPGTKVSIKGGPQQADNYTWWQVDNGSGVSGWVAAGPVESPWLVPEQAQATAASGPKLLTRPVKLGDRVQVTSAKYLTVRVGAGINTEAVARVVPGTQFTIRSGPVRQDNFNWWQVEGDQVNGWAAEGDETDRWLSAIE
jgi:uncharacterized protein YgiM (DUF1202 family)